MIIGLTGKAGAGKSTAARILSSKMGFARRPFAYPIKAMLGALGVPRDHLDGNAAIKERPSLLFDGRTLRHAMQTLGTEWGRAQFGDDFWVRMWLRGLSELGDVVADDVRFPNEAAAIKRLGGTIIRIDRQGSGATVGGSHASENVDAVRHDYILWNDFAEADLESSLRRILADVEKTRAAVAAE